MCSMWVWEKCRLNAARNIAIPYIDEIITQKAIELGLIQVDEDGKEKTKKGKKSVKKAS